MDLTLPLASFSIVSFVAEVTSGGGDGRVFIFISFLIILPAEKSTRADTLFKTGFTATARAEPRACTKHKTTQTEQTEQWTICAA